LYWNVEYINNVLSFYKAYTSTLSRKFLKEFLMLSLANFGCFRASRSAKVRNFKDYIDLHVKSTDEDSGPPIKIVHEVANERWEVACCPSDRGFQQVSFVNSIATYKGGRHVDHVVDNLIKQLLEVLKKKNKGGFCFELPRAHTDLCNPFQVALTSSPSRCGIISGFSSIV